MSDSRRSLANEVTLIQYWKCKKHEHCYTNDHIGPARIAEEVRIMCHSTCQCWRHTVLAYEDWLLSLETGDLKL